MKSEILARQFNDMLEQELKKIYRFFVQQERELYLQINTRLHVRSKYESFSLAQLEKELDELQTLSSYATSLSCYIYLNITGMHKILKKFDKKFKRYNLDFTRNFIVEKYQKKNRDLLYIYQYKILDEVGACVEQLKNELQAQYNFLIKNPMKELNNARLQKYNDQIQNKESINSDDNSDALLTDEVKEALSNQQEINNLKNKFSSLNNSIGNMEAFHHSISMVFEIWMRYIKANEYKSHIYTVKSTKDIYNNKDGTKQVKKNEPRHFLSQESYWNIRLILTQAFIMSICSTYFYPTIYYFLKSSSFSQEGTVLEKERRGLYCGLIIGLNPLGGLISMTYSHLMMYKSYKIPMITSSILSVIGNLLFILGIYHSRVLLLCFGTLITGFSLNTPVHRQYLLYFIPKRKMSKYLLYFKLFVLGGNSAGPLLSLFFLAIFKNDYIKENRMFNEYTLPGCVSFVISLIVLLLIIIIFSEPLSPRFMVYAEGQAPTDTMKRADSFTLDDSLTIFESEKLNEINQKVSLFNDENQFDDTNLVSSTINELIEVEIEPHGTVRKAFWVIISYVFILSFTMFSYITMCPSYLYENLFIGNDNITRPKAQRIISFLFFASLFLFIPAFCLNFFYISIRINKILYIKILALLLLSVELLTAAFVVQSNIRAIQILYYFSFLSTILLSYILEDQIIYFYTTIIPANFTLMTIKGTTIFHVMRYLGSIVGGISSLLGFSLSKIDEKVQYEETLIIIQISFAMIIQFIILVLFFINSNRFSDRPIRRLVFSKNVREIRRTEF